MNKSTLLLSSVLSCGILLHQANAADLDTNTARLQAMDKITGRVSEIDVPVNGLANFGSFSVLVRRCVTKSPEETPENTAFVDIVDNYKTTKPVNIFKGWMFSSTPALNAVEHPIYDIWLLKCHNSRINSETLLTEEQLALRDTIPVAQTKKSDLRTKVETLETPDIEKIQTVETKSIQQDFETPDAEDEFVSEGEEPEENDAFEVIQITNETLNQVQPEKTSPDEQDKTPQAL